jgi:hypothetical protein
MPNIQRRATERTQGMSLCVFHDKHVAGRVVAAARVAGDDAPAAVRLATPTFAGPARCLRDSRRWEVAFNAGGCMRDECIHGRPPWPTADRTITAWWATLLRPARCSAFLGVAMRPTLYVTLIDGVMTTATRESPEPARTARASAPRVMAGFSENNCQGG